MGHTPTLEHLGCQIEADALMKRVASLKAVLAAFVAEHDSVADTEGSAWSGAEGRPDGGWRCGCAEFCVPARAAIAEAEGSPVSARGEANE